MLRVLPLLLALSSSSLGVDVTLSSASDFTTFVNEVNSGTSYSGTTVYLDSDITFSGMAFTTPIDYFSGVFDGQGHIISDLTISPSSQYTGLFGISWGLTIKNVVLDSSCLMTSSSLGYVGGIIGWCYANVEGCSIESIVNMAAVTFVGSTSSDMWIGGIVGYLTSEFGYAYAKNCVNYGSVTHSGQVSSQAYLGGIVGYSQGDLFIYIQNCLNYGTIMHNGTSSNLAVGGIVGYGYYTKIENCLSAGKIPAQKIASGNNYIGSITGYVDSSIHINYCYYTNNVGASSLNGYGTPTTTGATNSTTDVDSELMSKLNTSATGNNWDNWFMLHLNGGSINNITQEFLVEIQRHIPNPTKEGNSFLFWCKDAECVNVFNPETESVSGITDLYAAWANSIVTFDFGNGTVVNETFAYNTEIVYPDIVKEGYTFSRWDNYHEFMPARDITVTAQWTPNNYAVAFDFGNGTTVNVTFAYNTEIIYPDMKMEGYTLSWDNYHEFMPAKNITVIAQWTPNNYTVAFDANGGDVSEISKNVTFNSVYGELPEPKMAGYMFLGWFNVSGELITSETKVLTSENHVFYAQWTPNNYTVAFDANGGNVSEISKNVTFNSVYGELPEPKRAGYMFFGWFIKDDEKVINETIVTTPHNHTLYAHWEEVSTRVEIVFGKIDLTKEEVKMLLKQYTNAGYEITKFERSSESDELTVIIKFIDKDDAEEFVDEINKSGRGDDIKSVKFVFGDDSLSTTVYPLSFFGVLFL